ncbi:MAG: SDR family NAD(P)-dependent oxidoreductase, partial [Pseudomonadota bacterium]|nr:SDR family NAD(P)-dependent oxidoreductase [Pseudomonadota bacterium]
MASKLDGKCALVTGGSGEIGRALCVRLAACGADVIFTFFSNHDGAEETSRAVEAVGGRAIAVRAHLGKEKAIDNLVDAVRAETSQVDIFIHNAASGVLRRAEELSRRHWD